MTARKHSDAIASIETKSGTLHYNVLPFSAGYQGEIVHVLHRRPDFGQRQITRYSKMYKTERGARNWLKREAALQTPYTPTNAAAKAVADALDEIHNTDAASRRELARICQQYSSEAYINGYA